MHALFLSSRSHVFTLHRTDDYIKKPKNTGYRSLHLVYKYDSPQKPAWRNMRVELQIRSQYQHAWATAVEAVSFFTGQDLKAAEGGKAWVALLSIDGQLDRVRGTLFDSSGNTNGTQRLL